MYRDEKWDPSYGIGLMFSKIDNSVDYFLAELDKDSISNESYDENRCSAITTVALLVWLYKINK